MRICTDVHQSETVGFRITERIDIREAPNRLHPPPPPPPPILIRSSEEIVEIVPDPVSQFALGALAGFRPPNKSLGVGRKQPNYPSALFGFEAADQKPLHTPQRHGGDSANLNETKKSARNAQLKVFLVRASELEITVPSNKRVLELGRKQPNYPGAQYSDSKPPIRSPYAAAHERLVIPPMRRKKVKDFGAAKRVPEELRMLLLSAGGALEETRIQAGLVGLPGNTYARRCCNFDRAGCNRKRNRNENLSLIPNAKGTVDSGQQYEKSCRVWSTEYDDADDGSWFKGRVVEDGSGVNRSTPSSGTSRVLSMVKHPHRTRTRVLKWAARRQGWRSKNGRSTRACVDGGDAQLVLPGDLREITAQEQETP
ncbi:hypothetical protein DFH09DRAFT_1417122 [Mycena vulgaris]|nr:hypothetical protein DFH09DRAFT_1417122 [Mycena vulgaris]